MASTLFEKLYKRRRIALSLVIVLGVFFYAFWSSLANKDFLVVPGMFWDAQGKGNAVAEEFVSLSDASRKNLERIKELEERGRANEALNLIRDEVNQAQDAKSKGSELLESLSQMTYSLSGIRPDGARAIAHEAIIYRIEMVNNLIAYSDGLEQIVRLLTSKVLYGDDVSAALQTKIFEVNESARSVNELDDKFNEAVEKLENF